MKLSILIGFTLLYNCLEAQKIKLSKEIKNDGIEYRVMRTSMDFIDSNHVKPSIDLIRVFLADSLRLRVKSFSNQEWVALLLNPNTDWAANLLLYEKYEKDAIVFRLIKSRDAWTNVKRADDLKYWMNKLMNK